MEENSDNSDTEMPKRNIELIITDQPTEVINTENALYHDILEKEIPDTAYIIDLDAKCVLHPSLLAAGTRHLRKI